MAKKNFFNKKNRYSSEEKFKYHSSRDSAPGKFNIKYGGTKHCYSFGFVDGFSNIDNSSAVSNEFGKRSSNSYKIGNKRGKKAAREYFERTGKQPSIFAIEAKYR